MIFDLTLLVLLVAKIIHGPSQPLLEDLRPVAATHEAPVHRAQKLHESHCGSDQEKRK